MLDNQTLPVNKKDGATIQRGKHDKEHPFVMISKSMIRDPQLSLKAKGLLTYLLSLPDNWKTHPPQVAKAVGIGKDQIYTILKELIDSGYATKREIKDEKNRFSEVIYEFYEEKLNTQEVKEKIAVSGFPDTGIPDTGIPDTGIPDTLNQTLLISYSKENIQEEYNTSLKVPEVATGVAVEVFEKPLLPKKKKASAEFSPKVRDVSNQMVNLLIKHNPVYRPPDDLTKFMQNVQQMIEDDKQDVEILLATFEWAVSDNEKRDTFSGWQGIVATNKKAGKETNPAKIFREYYSKIHSQMNSKVKRKFGQSANDIQTTAKYKEWSKNAL